MKNTLLLEKEKKSKMAVIELHTVIHAPLERCFDLSRSIDLHQSSMDKSKEKAVAGRVTGLIELGETVTWEATHFYVRQNLSSKITEMDRPSYFVDEMVKGTFKSFRHRHSFEQQQEYTLMRDEFRYEVPFGFLGKLFDTLVLNDYLTQLLTSRNNHIKEIAESEAWRKFLL